MLYHAGDSRHTQNIQINKVIGENEKCVFYFMEKTYGLFGQHNRCKNSTKNNILDIINDLLVLLCMIFYNFKFGLCSMNLL